MRPLWFKSSHQPVTVMHSVPPHTLLPLQHHSSFSTYPVTHHALHTHTYIRMCVCACAPPTHHPLKHPPPHTHAIHQHTHPSHPSTLHSRAASMNWSYRWWVRSGSGKLRKNCFIVPVTSCTLYTSWFTTTPFASVVSNHE